MQAIYIDTRSREITARAVWVTQAGEKDNIVGLVIREAAELPEMPYMADLYLIDATGYEAVNSAGYVDVIHNSTTKFQIWGELMIDGRGLRPVAPRRVIAVSDGHIDDIKTHKNSNVDVARTAYQALAECYSRNDSPVLVMEGQSDYTRAFTVNGKLSEIPGELPEEHRTDIVNWLASATTGVMEKHYWSYYWDHSSKEYKHGALLSKVLAVLMGAEIEDFTASREVAEEIVRRLVSRGVEHHRMEYFIKDSEEDVEALEQRAAAEIERITSVTCIDAYHDDDPSERTYTWIVPEDLVGEIEPGDRVEVDTRNGESTAIVTKVYKGVYDPRRRYVLDKLS